MACREVVHKTVRFATVSDSITGVAAACAPGRGGCCCANTLLKELSGQCMNRAEHVVSPAGGTVPNFQHRFVAQSIQQHLHGAEITDQRLADTGGGRQVEVGGHRPETGEAAQLRRVEQFDTAMHGSV